MQSGPKNISDLWRSSWVDLLSRYRDIDQNVSRGTIERLEIHFKLLCQWNSKINLVSKNSKQSASDVFPQLHWLSRHYLDSLQLVNHIPQKVNTMIDLGSGAGFPGLVLGACFPNNCVHLFERDKRKASFLEITAAQMKVNVNVHIKDLDRAICDNLTIKGDIITARALRPLDQLIEYAHAFIDDDGMLLAHKGKNWQVEVQHAQKKYAFDLQAIPSITEAEACILKIKNIKSHC